MIKPKKWDDLYDILYDGSKEEMKDVVCPECGGNISYRYCDEVNSFEVSCNACGRIDRAIGAPKPACSKFFGDVYTFM